MNWKTGFLVGGLLSLLVVAFLPAPERASALQAATPTITPRYSYSMSGGNASIDNCFPGLFTTVIQLNPGQVYLYCAAYTQTPGATVTDTPLPTATNTPLPTETPTIVPTNTTIPTPTAPISVFVYTNPPLPTPTELIPWTVLVIQVSQQGNPLPGVPVTIESCEVPGPVCQANQFQTTDVQTADADGRVQAFVRPDYYYRFTANGMPTLLYIPAGSPYQWIELALP